MPITMKSLGIDQLPREARLELVQALWDSIAGEPASPASTEPQRAELLQRIAEDDAAPDDVVGWDQVQADAHARLHQR